MLKIITNNRPRDVLRWYELTDKERAEFVDYIDTDDKQANAEFVRYRDWTYDLGDMERGLGGSQMPRELSRWDNYATDSFFSGVVVKYVDDCERVICGTFYSVSEDA